MFYAYICNKMISKAKQRLIKCLDNKRGRQEHGLFLAEGPKVVEELLTAFVPQWVVATSSWWAEHSAAVALSVEREEVSTDELQRLSLQQHPQEVLAVFRLPQEVTDGVNPNEQLVLALDGVRDPGNMGTIIRLADWFGLHEVICSPDCADVFNPKVVQATMGSLARVHISYRDLPSLADSLLPSTPVYGLLLEGKNLYTEPLEQRGLMVMGNEGRGLSDAMRSRVTQALRIPSWPLGAYTAESLNVATATAIACAEFRRRAGEASCWSK